MNRYFFGSVCLTATTSTVHTKIHKFRVVSVKCRCTIRIVCAVGTLCHTVEFQLVVDVLNHLADKIVAHNNWTRICIILNEYLRHMVVRVPKTKTVYR